MDEKVGDLIWVWLSACWRLRMSVKRDSVEGLRLVETCPLALASLKL